MSQNYFRDYEFRSGVYLQRDRIGLGGGLNTRAHSNNPIAVFDRFGLRPTKPNFGDQCAEDELDSVRDYQEYFNVRFPHLIDYAKRTFTERIKKKICALLPSTPDQVDGLTGANDDIDYQADKAGNGEERYMDKPQGF